MNHRPRKRFGQHFLVSPDVIDRIVAAVAPAAGDVLVEIGPGKGAITEPLSQLAGELHAIELDRDLARRLRERFANRPGVTIHEADALAFPFAELGDRLRLVGNLPYNISTPLMFHLLQFSPRLVDAHFMLQREVVTRLCAAPGTRDYGRLTITMGTRMEVVPLFDVGPEAFSPPPKVNSAVVRMRPRPADRPAPADRALFDALVRLAFSRRRKTLRNALRGMADEADLAAVALDAGDRPERVAVEDWIALADRLASVPRDD